MRALLDVVFIAIDLYMDVIILAAILSWLLAFGIVNVRNEVVRAVASTLNALTEPFLWQIRRHLPVSGGVDISPVVLYLLVLLIQKILLYYIYPYVF